LRAAIQFGFASADVGCGASPERVGCARWGLLAMSLVGSLEDLGLGDILQIVHLSGKSGVLALRSDVGEGQIVFDKGMLRSARARGLPQDLRELIQRRKAIPSDALAEVTRDARRLGIPLAEAIVQRGLMTGEALEQLRGQGAADAVLEMFRWRAGEFSFEVRDYAAGGGDLALASAMNPQFLALEGTRQYDEAADGEPTEDENDESTDVVAALPIDPADDPFAETTAPPASIVAIDEADSDAAGAIAAARSSDSAARSLPAASAGESATEAPRSTQPEPSSTHERRGLAALELGAAAADAPAASSPTGQPPAIVVIDPSFAALEWTKSALAGYPRVHAFQHTELGIQRIRQYLLRRELPIVLLAAATPPDPVSGARDVLDVATRLRRQAPRLPIVVVSAAGSRPPQRRLSAAAPSAFAERPKDGALLDARRSAERLEFAAALRAIVERLPDAAAPSSPAPPLPATPEAQADLARLRDASSRLRERARQGEVLSNVLSFAAQSFSRVALFMLRDATLVGIAQIGLGKAGGPDDAALRDVHLPARESSWVRRVLDTLQPVRGRPVDDGDHRLCLMLGNESPSEAFLAPIESANRVVAVLYADSLPSRLLLPDTGALEVVLHEAGLALDRSLLERALEEAGDGAAGG
jgi:hypothetical protein